MKKFKKKSVKWIIIAVLAIVVATGVIVFAKNRTGSSYAQTDSKRQRSIALQKMDLTKSISATGTIESGDSKTVSAQLDGIKIKKVNVSVGDEVKKGDQLLKFDTTDLKEAIADAKENLTDVQNDYNSSISSAQNKLYDAQSTYNSDNTSLEKKVADVKKSLENIKNEIKTLKQKIADTKDREKKCPCKNSFQRQRKVKKACKMNMKRLKIIEIIQINRINPV